MGTDEHSVVVEFEAIDATQVALVGGKGAQLGALTKLDGIKVPAGFCVTTAAFRRSVMAVAEVDALVDRLAMLTLDDAAQAGALAAALRATISQVELPADVTAAVRQAHAKLGVDGAYAVRSSATAEDSADASFAGLHESVLGVVGADAVLLQLRACWASLYSEEAVTYRLRNGIDHRGVEMAVVVQPMVPAHAAGVLFTADPISGNRNLVTIEAVHGLGEELVLGLVTPHGFGVRGGEIVTRTSAGGAPPLTDAQVVELAALGRVIEAQLGSPQDVEWCLAGDEFSIVQSRPITTLFPVPDSGDDDRHVYISVGHQQMMTDAMKPLGLSLWQRMAMPKMHEAAGRLFVDVADRLASPASRDVVVGAIGQGDPLIGDALRTVIERGFIAAVPDPDARQAPTVGPPAPEPIPTDPAIVRQLIARSEASTAALQRGIAGLQGPALFAHILDDIQALRDETFDPRSMQVIMAGMEAAWWLNEQLESWLGEKNAADTLAQSVDGNITSQMGLDLLDVADAIRPHSEVVAHLEGGVGDDVFDELAVLPGGAEARSAIEDYLRRYGMRCVGEIDITRPRWNEHPAALVPAILSNVRSFEAGEGRRRFERGRQQARDKTSELLQRLRDGGAERADEAERMIARLRTFSGYREFPKYAIVCRFASYKQALMAEADRLVRAGVLLDRDDCFFLRFDEFQDVASGQAVDRAVVDERRAAHGRYERLTPPRVLTSEGEAVTGTYRRDDVPAGALIGLAVSSGTIEGRARVVLDLGHAVFEPGDILVTAFTDPSWTPAFVAVSGLVTEVGGLMTHGAVIAREYGLPAVVGVEGATRRIRDGQRIRVHGTDGLVELLAG